MVISMRFSRCARPPRARAASIRQQQRAKDILIIHHQHQIMRMVILKKVGFLKLGQLNLPRVIERLLALGNPVLSGMLPQNRAIKGTIKV